MALALRYHYSSIDRPALKSKSHLVAQAIVSGSGDHVYMFVFVRLGVCVCLCKCSENVCVSSLVVFSKFFPALTSSFPSLTFLDKSQTGSESQCVFHVSNHGVWSHISRWYIPTQSQTCALLTLIWRYLYTYELTNTHIFTWTHTYTVHSPYTVYTQDEQKHLFQSLPLLDVPVTFTHCEQVSLKSFNSLFH